MKEMYEFLQRFGGASLDMFWFPLAIWTGIALIAFLILRFSRNLNPLYQYHLRVATIAAIPFGLLSTFVAQTLRSSTQGNTNFDGAIFVVQSPIELTVTATSSGSSFNPNWFEPNFLFGVVSILLLFISVWFLARLIYSYFTLRQLHSNIVKQPLSSLSEFSSEEFNHINVAYYQHPLVPFTFGWRNPIIVLPKSIQDDPEKVRMAIQHELVHIKRGDYLLQLFLSVIDSLFWFHPLVRFGSREIETYREISCDQEVLNSSGISLKSYATMLYELLPLNRGIGAFSVSMAVQQSTLKKRIKTMKNHKLYESSVSKSMLFLALMIVGVTLPIACSDLQGQQSLSEEVLENIQMELANPMVEINGVSISHGAENLSATGLFSFVLITQEYGAFKFAPTNFEGSVLAGEIDGSSAQFTVNELTVRIESESQILSEVGKSGLWAVHLTETGVISSFGLQPTNQPLEDMVTMLKERTIVQSHFVDDIGAYTVADEMPKLIGGLVSIQSKVVYPEQARKAGIQGRVTVQFVVDKEGNVVDPKIVTGIGGGCDEAALEAVSHAQFEPGKKDGEPVDVLYTLPIVFRLQDTE